MPALISKIERCIAQRSPFFSLEFSPPQANAANGTSVDEEVEKFVGTLACLRDGNPLFIDVTWFTRNSPGNLSITNSSSAIALLAKHRCGFEHTMLHITCNGEPKERTLGYVKQALDHGLTNILALRGDDVEPTPGQPLPPNGQQQEQQQYFAIDLVRWTRQLQQGRQLSVAVAGHPVGHPKAASYQQHLDHLKAKVDAGGDFIITQFFFEAQAFEQFQLDCRHVGITVPILPGILLYRNAASVIRIAKLSGIAIPPAILRVLEANRKHREVVENFALHSAYQLCHHLLSKGIVPGVHIYTMNQRLTTGLLLRRLGLWATVNPVEHRLLAYPTFGYCPLAWTRLAQLLLALAQQQQQQKQQRKNTLANGKRNGKVDAGEEEANAVKAAAAIILASQPPPFFVPINNGGGKQPPLLVNGGINGITANGVGMGMGGGGAVSIAKWLQQQQLVMTAAEGHHHAWHIRCAVGLASAAIFS